MILHLHCILIWEEKDWQNLKCRIFLMKLHILRQIILKSLNFGSYFVLIASWSYHTFFFRIPTFKCVSTCFTLKEYLKKFAKETWCLRLLSWLLLTIGHKLVPDFSFQLLKTYCNYSQAQPQLQVKLILKAELALFSVNLAPTPTNPPPTPTPTHTSSNWESVFSNISQWMSTK